MVRDPLAFRELMRSLLAGRSVSYTAVGLLVIGLALVTIGSLTDSSPETIDHSADATPAALLRDPDVPELPFGDNPDPEQCGIPTRWGSTEPAWLTGIYEGEMIQPTVFLYDSHQRFSLTGSAPHGTEVQVLMFQENPVLDFYYVKTGGPDPQEGWIPAPLLSFEPVTA